MCINKSYPRSFSHLNTMLSFNYNIISHICPLVISSIPKQTVIKSLTFQDCLTLNICYTIKQVLTFLLIPLLEESLLHNHYFRKCWFLDNR